MKQPWKWVLVAAIIVCFTLSMYFTYTQQTVYLTTAASFAGISAMLLVAYLTFLSMKESTDKTVESIMISTDQTVKSIMESTNQTISTMSQTSATQIDKFAELAKHLTISNRKLDGVYKNLKILADDLIEKKGLKPEILVSFYGRKEKIDVRTGEVTPITFYFFNSGHIRAVSPIVDLQFPPEIEIISGIENITSINKMDSQSLYPNYTSVKVNPPHIPAGYAGSAILELQIQRGCAGDIIIPYTCSFIDLPGYEGKLTINAIG